MNKHVGWAARVVVFVAFTSYVYSVKYAPVRFQPYDEALTTATIVAFNMGRPFQLAFPTGPGAPPTIYKMTEYYGDYGTHIPLSIAGIVGRRVYGPSYQLTSPLVRTLIFAFCLLVAAAMLAGPVPLAVGVTGVMSLWALFLWGTLGLYDARYWGVGVVAVVLTVYVGTTLKPWTRGRVGALVLLAAIAGYGQLLRQEAGPTTTITGLGLVGAAVVTYATMRRFARSPSPAPHIGARALAGGLLLLALNAAIVPAERLMFSRAWGTSYADTPFAVHGSGWPLYLSLGYVSNPFNIGWRDPIGELHARLIDPDIKLNADPAFQRTLMEEYVRIVLGRPWLLMRNVAAKAARVHELAGHPSGANTGTIITQPMPLVAIYWAAPAVAAALLLLLLWRGGPEAVVTWICAVAVAAAACAGPLLIFPEYIGGLQGATIALVLIVPAAVLSAGALTRETDIAEARRLFTAFGGVALVLVATGAVFVGVQALRYRRLQQETMDADPLRELRAREFRYAHVFNDLPVSRQGRLVAELQSANDESVAHVIDERSGNLDMFSPQVIVRTPAQIHVFVWMGRGFVPPVPRLFQGSTHASLLVCGNCPASASINDLQFPRGATMINDLEWQGRYRMFTVQNNVMLKDVPFLRVVAERVRALDTTLPTWIVPEPIASARLLFAGPQR